MRCTWILALCLIPFGSVPAFGQSGTELYELGRRLKLFEAAWEEQPDAKARQRAVEVLTRVHAQFQSFQFAEAGRTMDLATHMLRSESPPGANTQWVASLNAIPENRVVDGEAKEISVTIRPFYPLKAELPAGIEVQLWFTDKQVITVKPTKFPITVKVPLPPLGDSTGRDHKLYFMVEAGKAVRRYPVGISIIKNAADRVAAFKKAAAAWPMPETLEQATVRDRAELLTDMLDGTIWDTDLPAAGLLANGETMLNGKPFYTIEKTGEYWLSVPVGGKKTTPIRLFVPRGLDPNKPVPVVVGLHGMGGSENLFFEGYGAGRAVEECRKRGWVFIATRSGINFSSGPPVPLILEQLGKRLPLDPKRQFLVGHSMGAAQTVAVAQKNPGKFAAIAVLGGGGIVSDPKAFTGLPIFVAAGENDFGLSPATSLKKALNGSPAKFTFKEYPGVEHLLIVREALPEVFEGFDAVAGK